MGKPHAYVLAALGLLLALGWFLVGRSDNRGPATGAEDAAELDGAAGTGAVGGPVAPVAHDRDPSASAVVRDDIVYTPEDVRIFRETMEWARQGRLDTLPIGDIVVRTGRRFVGNPYTPHTLDPPGPERVIVNLREFDCVTYVESVLALARVIRDGAVRGDPPFPAFTEELRRIRYRGGEIDGWTSRLHYFTEWIADNERMGILNDITHTLGGRPDDERIDFMSTHADAYPALRRQPALVEEIEQIERELSTRTRTYIDQGRIGDIADGIRDGDIIAATSSVEGLDVAHTGFAIRVDGRLHLMHAPLVGKALEISEQPLAVRILRIDGQDGIIVSRPR